MDNQIINMDKQINEFKKTLLLSINDSGLPITVICLVLHEVINATDDRQRIILNEIYTKERQKDEIEKVKKKGENKKWQQFRTLKQRIISMLKRK